MRRDAWVCWGLRLLWLAIVAAVVEILIWR
jgi:hypothetical protein